MVQENAQLTAEQLSTSVALSPSAIQRRLRRLREQGVIARDIAVLDPRKAGKPTFFVVSLQVERERPELLAGLRKWLTTEPGIQQAYYVTGEADFVLVIAAPDTETFEGLMQRLLAENGNVRKFTTNVALGLIKQGLTIPIADDAGG